MNALKHRTIERDGHVWSLEVAEIRGHQPYSRQVSLRRDGELWATVKLKHTGALKTIKALPSYQVPDSIFAEIKKDLGVPNVS